MNFGAINLARRNAQDTELAGRISDEARIATELQQQTGCTRTEALKAAKLALAKCRFSTAAPGTAAAMKAGPTTIKSTNDPTFIEYWAREADARNRCDVLNRGLDHPAYFIA
jgi:hypothetical protein